MSSNPKSEMVRGQKAEVATHQAEIDPFGLVVGAGLERQRGRRNECGRNLEHGYYWVFLKIDVDQER